jgi:hypothetical protein
MEQIKNRRVPEPARNLAPNLREISQVFRTTGGRNLAPVPFLLIFSSLLFYRFLYWGNHEQQAHPGS